MRPAGNQSRECCLCGNPEAVRIEERKTADDGSTETWRFCRECWRELQRQRADTENAVCRKYVVFLQFLSGRYRMQRAFNGNQASRVMPKIAIDTLMHSIISSHYGKTKDHPDSGSGSHRTDENACGCGEKKCQRDNGKSLPRVYGTVQGICENDRKGQTEALICLETEPATVPAAADS